MRSCVRLVPIWLNVVTIWFADDALGVDEVPRSVMQPFQVLVALAIQVCV
jgi:hypothetical protein